MTTRTVIDTNFPIYSPFYFRLEHKPSILQQSNTPTLQPYNPNVGKVPFSIICGAFGILSFVIMGVGIYLTVDGLIIDPDTNTSNSGIGLMVVFAISTVASAVLSYRCKSNGD